MWVAMGAVWVDGCVVCACVRVEPVRRLRHLLGSPALFPQTPCSPQTSTANSGASRFCLLSERMHHGQPIQVGARRLLGLGCVLG